MYQRLLYIVASVFVVAFAAFPAIAQEDGTVIDFTEPLTAVITAIGALLGVVGMWLWNKVSTKWGLDKLISEEKVQEMLDKVLDEAVDYGVGKISTADWTKIETKNEVVGFAANYVLNHGGELLAKTGLTQDALIEKIEAKLLKHDKNPGVWVDAEDPQ